MSENQYLDQPLDVNLNIYKSVLEKYLPIIEKTKLPQKQAYQFQELTKKLFPFYGQKIFQLPYRTFYSDYKLEKAHEMCQKYKQVGNINYLIKVMRNMPY